MYLRIQMVAKLICIKLIWSHFVFVMMPFYCTNMFSPEKQKIHLNGPPPHHIVLYFDYIFILYWDVIKLPKTLTSSSGILHIQ